MIKEAQEQIDEITNSKAEKLNEAIKNADEHIAQLSLEMNILILELQQCKIRKDRKVIKEKLHAKIDEIEKAYKEFSQKNNSYGFKAKVRVMKLKAIKKMF